MVEKSLPESPVRHSRDSTRSLLATPKNIADAASWLMLDEEQADTFRRCVEGEPLARMLGVVQWLAEHEQDADYRPEVMIEGWARNRQAGCYRPEPVESGRRSLPRSGWGIRFTPEQVQANLDRMSG